VIPVTSLLPYLADNYRRLEKQEAIMLCRRCSSDRREFKSEIAIHFPGLKGLKAPIVWSFPSLLVCLECGFTEFTVPERELSVLVRGEAVKGAVVLDRGSSPVVRRGELLTVGGLRQ